MNCFHSFKTENKLESHKKVCENKDVCRTVMPSKKDNILEFNQYMKSNKMPYIIYADIESLIKKHRWMCKNPENSSKIQQKLKTKFLVDVQCGIDCMKKFFISVREDAGNVINFEKMKCYH